MAIQEPVYQQRKQVGQLRQPSGIASAYTATSRAVEEAEDHNEIDLLYTMVQGEKGGICTVIMQPERNTRKSGSEVTLKKPTVKADPKAEQNKKYGAWGPMYQNRSKFVDMHIC